jgi:hypothetical protein
VWNQEVINYLVHKIPPLIILQVEFVVREERVQTLLYNRLPCKDFEIKIRGPFERFVDWRQCAAVMQREAVTYAKL